jgi:hypothetical protein
VGWRDMVVMAMNGSVGGRWWGGELAS